MTIRSTAVACVVLAVAVAAATAAEVVQVVSWDGPTGVPPTPGVKVVGHGGNGRLEVKVEAPEGAVVPLVHLAEPGVTAPGWRLEGDATFDRIEGSAQVEMWAQFPDGGRYFSRALPWPGDGGSPVGAEAVRFALPFRLDATTPSPVALDVNLVVHGAVTVRFGPLRVVQVGPGESLLATAPAGWWSERQGALVGAVAGTSLGLLGALLGVLMARGVGLRAAAAALLAIAIAGIAALALALFALAGGQPYAVWFPLALLGLIAAVVGFALRPIARQRLSLLEEQRMRAADL